MKVFDINFRDYSGSNNDNEKTITFYIKEWVVNDTATKDTRHFNNAIEPDCDETIILLYILFILISLHKSEINTDRMLLNQFLC